MGLERKYVVISAIAGFIGWLLASAAIPSLRWIPYAFVAGAITTFLGLTYIVCTTSQNQQSFPRHARRQTVPAFLTPALWENEKAALKARSISKRIKLFPHSTKISRRIDDLLGLVLRDFVTVWYKNISSRSLFQNEVDCAIRQAIGNIRDRMASLDMVEIGVSRLVPIITNHTQDFYAAERLVRGKNLTRNMTESEELDVAIAGKYKDGRLHNAASLAFSGTKLMQQAHVRTVVRKILPLIMSTAMQSSPAVMVLVREIVACAVLAPVLLMLCDPDMWNQIIASFGRSMIQDRKSVRKLRAALDEHAPASPRGSRVAEVPRLRPNDNERQFERFIRSLRQAATLSDARRFRSEITSQIRRGAIMPEQDPVYIRRLDAGKRILDQKIIAFSTSNSASGRPQLEQRSSSATVDTVSKLKQASLKDILHNASGLSYFMEFMDRKGKMRLVQFWIIIDGFRNPLEEDTDEPGVTLQEQAQYNSADRMDIGQMKQAFLDLPEAHLQAVDKIAIDKYLKAGKTADMQAYVHARRAILRAQTSVFEELRDHHFSDFRSSALFYKWLATEEASAPQVALMTLSEQPMRRSLDIARPSGLKVSHPNASQIAQKAKEPELRRVVMSSTDLHSKNKPSQLSQPRRSVDDNGSRPLFDDDDINDERMTRSFPSLGEIDSDNESVDRNERSAQIVDAMQKELNDIMDEPYKQPDTPDLNARANLFGDSPAFSDDASQFSPMQPSKISIASLGLVGGSSSRGVFSDDLFAEEEEKFLSDEKEDDEDDNQTAEEGIHEAAPGDLGLAEAIDALHSDIERLTNQERIIDSLTKKAELTNNAAELRILRKSKQSLQREIHRKELQKQQYMVQESDNSLYGRAAINIKSIMVGKEEDGHEYAIYVIEVRRQAGDQMPAATWTVARRYSEFHDLHKRLRARFAAVRELEFPRRQTLFTLQKDFLRRRRVVLERYLRSLLLIPAICRSRELRAFLSQSAISSGATGDGRVDQGDFVTRIYNSVSDGMDDFIGNLPVLDQLTVAGQNLISAASAQMNGGPINNIESSLAQDPATAAEAEAELNAFEDREAEPFVKPISDLFLEIFELQKGTSWLRGRAVVVVLHQLLGGTVERKVRDTAKSFTQEASVLRYMDMVKDIMWPGGQMKPPSVPRTAAEKAQSREEANLILSTLIPDLAASVVGRANAQAASRKIVALLNNQRLNTHLVLTLFDEIVHVLFPEIQLQ